jgi:ABC-type transport system involved in cytochrome c biogenesis permease subunit
MSDMSLFWLRVAAILYAAGLLRILVTLLKQRQTEGISPAWERLAPTTGTWLLGSFVVGSVLHFVSLVERGLAHQHFPADNFYESLSLFAFLLAVFYLFVHWKYSFTSIGILLVPVVSLLAWIASTESPLTVWANPRVRGAWLLVHVAMILLGIASVCLTAGASIFYLAQERKLKRKDLGNTHLPALRTLDSLINRAMGIGFVFTTVGVLAGSTWAYVESGTRWLSNTNVLIALFTWLFYLTMVFLRATQGWRGRKSAFMALGLLGFSALTWATHYGLRSTLER